MREDKEKLLEKEMDCLLNVWHRSSKIRDGYDNFTRNMVVGSGIMALTGLLLLFHSSHHYDHSVICGMLFLIYSHIFIWR